MLHLNACQGYECASLLEYLTIIASIDYLFHCKICCQRKILRRTGVNV